MTGRPQQVKEERIWEACLYALSHGEIPSTRKIKAELGGASDRISAIVQKFKAEHEAAIQALEYTKIRRGTSQSVSRANMEKVCQTLESEIDALKNKACDKEVSKG